MSGLGYSKKLKLKQKQSPSLTVNSMAWPSVLLMSTEQLTSFHCLLCWRHRLWVCTRGPGREITEPTSTSAKLFGSVFAAFLPTLCLVMNLSLGSWCAYNSAAAGCRQVDPGQGKSPLQCLPQVTGTQSYFPFMQLSAVFSQQVCVSVCFPEAHFLGTPQTLTGRSLKAEGVANLPERNISLKILIAKGGGHSAVI